MSWKTRRRKGEGKKGRKDFAAEAVNKYASKLMNNRWHLLAPFPLERIDIYNALFSIEQHRAFDLLKRTAPTTLSMGSEFNLIFDMSTDVRVRDRAAKPRYLKVSLDMSMPMPDTNTISGPPDHTFLLSQLPPHLLEPIMEWSKQWLTACRETREVCGKLTVLFDTCSTMGQIKRVWPNACNLLPDKAQADLRNAKVKSSYPDAVLDHVNWREDGKEVKTLKDEWKPETLAWYDDRLTEALCLPMENPDSDFDVEIEYVL
jgi:hypothetical protein